MDDGAVEEGIGFEPNALQRRRLSRTRQPLAALPSKVKAFILAEAGRVGLPRPLSSPGFEPGAVANLLALPKHAGVLPLDDHSSSVRAEHQQSSWDSNPDFPLLK